MDRSRGGMVAAERFEKHPLLKQLIGTMANRSAIPTRRTETRSLSTRIEEVAVPYAVDVETDYILKHNLAASVLRPSMTRRPTDAAMWRHPLSQRRLRGRSIVGRKAVAHRHIRLSVWLMGRVLQVSPVHLKSPRIFRLGFRA
jgi:hypothetical protein